MQQTAVELKSRLVRWKPELGNAGSVLRAGDGEQGGKAGTWRVNPESPASLCLVFRRREQRMEDRQIGRARRIESDCRSLPRGKQREDEAGTEGRKTKFVISHL